MTVTKRNNVLAAVVLIGALAAWIVMPHQLLGPIALALVLAAFGGVFGIRAWRRHLHDVETFLESNRDRYQPALLSALLTGTESQILRTGVPVGADEAIGILRARQELLLNVGMFLAIVGIGAAIVTLGVYD
jgi:hypothetical protein